MIANTVLDLIHQYGYFFFFIAFTLGPFGVPIPNEVTILSAALLSHTGVMNPWITYICILSGLLIAITISYFIGKICGKSLLKKYNNHRHFLKAQSIFNKRGHWAMFIGMFIPVVRYVMPLFVGISGIEYKKFAIITYSSALVWTILFFVIGTFFSDFVSAFIKI